MHCHHLQCIHRWRVFFCFFEFQIYNAFWFYCTKESFCNGSILVFSPSEELQLTPQIFLGFLSYTVIITWLRACFFSSTIFDFTETCRFLHEFFILVICLWVGSVFKRDSQEKEVPCDFLGALQTASDEYHVRLSCVMSPVSLSLSPKPSFTRDPISWTTCLGSRPFPASLDGIVLHALIFPRVLQLKAYCR